MNLNLKKESLRKVNETLQSIDRKSNKKIFKISNPDGNHAICAGLKDEIEVTIDGHTGYYCAGMNMNANIIVNGVSWFSWFFMVFGWFPWFSRWFHGFSCFLVGFHGFVG